MIDDDKCRAVCGMRIGKENRSARRKPAPVSLCPTWPDLGSNPSVAEGSRRVTAWAMAPPIVTLDILPKLNTLCIRRQEKKSVIYFTSLFLLKRRARNILRVHWHTAQLCVKKFAVFRSFDAFVPLYYRLQWHKRWLSDPPPPRKRGSGRDSSQENMKAKKLELHLCGQSSVQDDFRTFIDALRGCNVNTRVEGHILQ
jgi:hypothetical protein